MKYFATENSISLKIHIIIKVRKFIEVYKLVIYNGQIAAIRRLINALPLPSFFVQLKMYVLHHDVNDVAPTLYTSLITDCVNYLFDYSTN